ncbi:MAG: hypothetical protein A3A27_00570 [Candidatus Wildermuthbacteria bacterium RIFCSPLOWO2_01_FULL_47_18]|uniref:Transposase IS200-like domain-containing protein n=1 Tax=Candidatus Wildermuthbacteria bacterium RIFCSPLOWO2_01_FULL_47_18 TaxID=1802460 RepID=A0A1G2RHG3_9BACT|nr:MAG: hypothetical protein A3A27_00570 [Candidatus Wildermuthbacteria bacterium RIFCSPLOWO2_01_FULL_47_18]
MQLFNTITPIGSLYELSFAKDVTTVVNKPLVNFVAYCLNPNHFHFLLQQKQDCGVSEIMKRLGAGYAGFFNLKYKRTGALFSGKYKVKHVTDNDYLLHLSAYVNLNDRVHEINSPIVRSSWGEYSENPNGFCKTSIVLKQFKSKKDYTTFALDSLKLMLDRKAEDKDLSAFLID